MQIVSIRLIMSAAILAVVTVSAQADPVADFYRGKTIRLIVGYPAGGNYDLYGRLAVEHLGRHIPGNPTIIAVNMPGAGGFRAVEYLYKVAPQDGTHLGSVAQQLAMHLLLDDKLGIDPIRFNYLGRIATNIDIAVALPRSGIESFEDARRRELTVGAGTTSSTSAVFARALNTYAGTKFKVVTGYQRYCRELSSPSSAVKSTLTVASWWPSCLPHSPTGYMGRPCSCIRTPSSASRQSRRCRPCSSWRPATRGALVMNALAGTAEVGRSILTTPGVPPERLAGAAHRFCGDGQGSAIRGFRQNAQDPD